MQQNAEKFKGANTNAMHSTNTLSEKGLTGAL